MRPVILVISLLIAATAQAQKRHRPNIDVPAHWNQPIPQSTAADTETLRSWWRTFDDAALTSLVGWAIESNLDLKTALARISEARAARGIAGAALKPSVGTSVGYTRVRGGIAQGLRTPFETDVYQVGFDSSWELDLAGGLRQSVKVADVNIRAAEDARNDVRVSVAAEVGRNYMALRGAQRRLAIVEENIALQADSVHLTEARRSAGLAPELDVIRANAQLRQTKAEEASVQAEIDRLMNALAVLVGRAPGDLPAELLLQKPLPALPKSIATAVPADVLLRRPDLRRSAAEIAAAAARIGVARADLYPKVTLSALIGRQSTTPGGLTLGFGNFFSLGPVLRLPLFSGGRIRSNIAVEEAKWEQANLRYEASVLSALAEVENALGDLRREGVRENELDAAEGHNRDSVNLTRELYSKGLGDYLQVLDAQRELLATQHQLAESQTDVLVDLIRLYKAVGGGW
jgi:NodT family efflux transporter outer membrane factor (OMF) lipoprotein